MVPFGGECAFDMAGTQYNESQSFANVPSKVLTVPMAPSSR